MAPETALRQLLQGTDLAGRFAETDLIIIERVALDGTQPVNLVPITVLGSRQPNAPLSNVPSSITQVDREEIEEEVLTTSRVVTLFNAGVVYSRIEPLDIYATFSQGAEVTQLGRAAREAASADQIDPQAAKSNQYEIGLRGAFGDVEFGVAGFYTESDLLSALECNTVDPCPRCVSPASSGASKPMPTGISTRNGMSAASSPGRTASASSRAVKPAGSPAGT